MYMTRKDCTQAYAWFIPDESWKTALADASDQGMSPGPRTAFFAPPVLARNIDWPA